MSTGLDVEVIDVQEENRLTSAAVVEYLKASPIWVPRRFLVVEWAGQRRLTLLSGVELVQSGTFALGSIRSRQA